MIIPFNEWLPDLPDFNNQGATVVKNVIPHAKSYLPMPSAQVISTALDSACLGSYATQDKASVTYNYAGDTAKLYDLTAGVFTSVSGMTYTTSSPNRWEFVKWGEQVIATNYDNPIQVITMGGAAFSDLAVSAPRAKHIAVIRDFVIAGNLHDGTTAIPNGVQWSAINNETDWTPNAATQADYQYLQGNGGEVQAIVGGEYGVILQEYSIWRMTYVGSPLVFQFDEVETGKGTPSPYSVKAIGSNVFYLGWDGFYIFDGSTSTNISVDKVSKTFWADIDQSYTDQVVAAIDPINTIVAWLYHGTGHSGTANKIITYNWANNKWSPIDLIAEHLSESRSSAYTLEQLDAISATVEGLPVSLDSRGYKGGTLMLTCFNASHQLASFTGDAMQAEIETGEMQPNPYGRAIIDSVRPLVDGECTIGIGHRTKQTDTVTYSLDTATDSDGKASFRVNDRYHRFIVKTTGSFSHAEGIDISATKEGTR